MAFSQNDNLPFAFLARSGFFNVMFGVKKTKSGRPAKSFLRLFFRFGPIVSGLGDCFYRSRCSPLYLHLQVMFDMSFKTFVALLCALALRPAAAEFRPAPGAGARLSGFEAEIYRCENGMAEFRSDAPLEIIEAKSRLLRGVVDPAAQTFAWSVDIKTFDGFNSPLQREHFNENYLESRQFPKATFRGKIIEKVDFQKNGVYTVRAKGKLNIHGVEQERIIRSRLEINGQRLRVQSDFTVPLADHNIAIPRVVHQKIAEEIAVSVRADLLWESSE